MFSISIYHWSLPLLVGCILSCLYVFSRPRKSRIALCGPPSKSLIFGVSKYLRQSGDSGAILEEWAKEYGSVYAIPTGMGSHFVVVWDSKAIAHIFSKDATIYVRSKAFKAMLEKLIGKGILWADGPSHKRQRKSLNPAFSNPVIRTLTPVFFDVTYKMKAAWDTILDSSTTGETTIEVSQWLNKLSIDCIGIGAFAHDFGALEGKTCAAKEALDTFSDTKLTWMSTVVYILQDVIPGESLFPTQRNRLLARLSDATRDILGRLLEKSKAEKGDSLPALPASKTAIGILTHAETNLEEVIAQMKAILIAGYDNPAIAILWALIELSKHIDIQEKLREELNTHLGADCTLDELNHSFPLLDSVVWEVLRLHPSLAEIRRIAERDDVIYLNTPIVDNAGITRDHILLEKGTLVTVPVRGLNCSNALWGPDAKEFNPGRFMGGSRVSRKSDILSFGEGPRVCLGKAFTLAQMKAALMVLIREYSFELPGGPTTEVLTHFALLSRPTLVTGEESARVPLRVRRLK